MKSNGSSFQDELGIELKASFNPRRSKAITEELPRGIERITPDGVPICLAGHELDYQGIRYASEKFIYRAPHGECNPPSARARQPWVGPYTHHLQLGSGTAVRIPGRCENA